MTADFYRAFEERYRGSRDLIKSRLRAYLPFVRPLAELYPGAPTADLGCGRGEWLELMTEIGFRPTGVDLDAGMLQACVEQGLSAEHGDAIAYLATLADESQAVVSAFHVVEHISFDELRIVVSEGMRVLKPGGLLILETPNPENFKVATKDFYLDPTHHRPIPPELLSFVPQYFGFERVKILRLHESDSLGRSAGKISLRDVLSGVSPDYAVVAQKNGGTEMRTATDPAFEVEYGLSFETLVAMYEQGVEEDARRTETIARQTRQLAHQTEEQIRQLESALEAILASRSWRITAPLRMVSGLVKPPMKKLIRWSAQLPLKLVRNTPLLMRFARWALARSPALRSVAGRLVSDPSAAAAIARPKVFEDLKSVQIMDALSQLPPSSQSDSVVFLKVADDRS
jgi:SAM-dependent methyltransferase